MSNWKQDYDANGYHFPIRAISAEQAIEYRNQLEHVEGLVSDDPAKRKLMQLQPAAVLNFVDEIARLPSIVNPVTEILGDDVLLWNATFFIKEAHSPSYISWHQDLKYWGLEESHEVTAWLALTDVTTATGCMKFVAGTHKMDMVEHNDTFEENNLLSRGQEIAVDVNEDEAVHVELKPGELSLHHGKLFHGSSPNETSDRRIGLALRYISTDMSQSADLRPYAKLVSGEDKFGHFQLMDKPTGVLSDKDVAIAYENIKIQEQFLFAGTNPQR
jgi:chlorinating enzyme